MSYSQIVQRIINVINSCETMIQLNVADNYCFRLIQYYYGSYETIYTRHDLETYLYGIAYIKRDELRKLDEI